MLDNSREMKLREELKKEIATIQKLADVLKGDFGLFGSIALKFAQYNACGVTFNDRYVALNLRGQQETTHKYFSPPRNSKPAIVPEMMFLAILVDNEIKDEYENRKIAIKQLAEWCKKILRVNNLKLKEFKLAPAPGLRFITHLTKKSGKIE